MKDWVVNLIFPFIAIILAILTYNVANKEVSNFENKGKDTILFISPSLNDFQTTIRDIHQDINVHQKHETEGISKVTRTIQQGNKKLLIIETRLDSILNRISMTSFNNDILE